MRKEKLHGMLIVMLCSIIFVLLGVNAALIYKFIIQDKTNKNTVSVNNGEDVADVPQITSEHVSGKDITLLTDTYFEVTIHGENGSVTDYVDDDVIVTYIRTNNGDAFEHYQTANDLYGYAMANDTDSKVSFSGVAHWSGDTQFSSSKTKLAESYEEQLRPVFDNMVYSSTVGNDWLYEYNGEGNDATDLSTQKVIVYVDSTSHRVSRLASPFCAMNFRYSDNPIDPVFSIEDFKKIGIEEVDSNETIYNMEYMYSMSITSDGYDDKNLDDMLKQMQEISDNTTGGNNGS